MNKDKISWCKKQRKGISLIEPKIHLSCSYMKEAEETLENVFSSTGKWKLITAYYACYSALYSLLMKAGIKCEIHDCTMGLMPFFGFNASDIEYMKKLKEDRIRAQYYLRKVLLEDEERVKEFISSCKLLVVDLSSEKIEKIRTRLKN